MIVEFTEKEIQDKIKQIADLINQKQHDKPPVFICVLNGAFMFFTDLVKQVGKCEIDFIRELQLIDKNVYLIDDIYDSGNTMKALIKHLSNEKTNSITPITLFKKWHSNHPDLIYGFELTDEHWLIGYGLDASDGTQRNLTYIKGIQPGD